VLYGEKDQEPFYSGSKECLRRGFFGRPKKQGSLRMTVLERQSPEWHNTGEGMRRPPPCHSEQAVFNKNTNMKL
jgi:hypothetical protein